MNEAIQSAIQARISLIGKSKRTLGSEAAKTTMKSSDRLFDKIEFTKDGHDIKVRAVKRDGGDVDTTFTTKDMMSYDFESKLKQLAC